MLQHEDLATGLGVKDAVRFLQNIERQILRERVLSFEVDLDNAMDQLALAFEDSEATKHDREKRVSDTVEAWRQYSASKAG